MAFEPPFSIIRTSAFKSILVLAFKILPAGVKQVLAANGWNSFGDFMEAVARAGQVYLKDKAPSPERIRQHGVDAEIKHLRNLANTEAMLKLLAQVFYGEPDEVAAFEALEPYGITSWHEMSLKTLNMALENSRRNHWADAKGPTKAFATLQDSPTRERVAEVVEAFGLLSPKHFEALLEGFYHAEITVEDLDRAVNNHELMTEFARRAPSNPHKELVFGRFSDGGRMRPPTLGDARRPTYTEELIAQGLTALRTTEEVKEAFQMFGPPNRIYREDGDIKAIFERSHPDGATVFVDDGEEGRYVAVDAREMGPPHPRLSGNLDPGSDVVLLRDLDTPQSRPGCFVAARAEDWASEKAVIEGWRGPSMDSEEFGRTRLAPVNCGTVFQDISGYWDCVPAGTKVY